MYLKTSSSAALLFSASATFAAPNPAASTQKLEKRDCPAGFKNVVFNGGSTPDQFNQITGAANWLTFGLGTNPGQIPMMAFASDVQNAVAMVNGDSPPEWMLTFNEPDYSYAGVSPTMSPQDAATAIAPLLASPGTATKFVAPVTADPTSDWLTDFYAACNCQSFFSAYNIHVYLPDSASAEADITTFHNKFADKPLWVTEIAPGNANPSCSLSWDQAGQYMNDIYSWGAAQGWIDKIFWNSGNQIPNDSNVCNSYLLDSNDQPTPLLTTYYANENC